MEKEGERSQCMSSELKSNFETLKKRKLDGSAARRVAEATANLVESEIQQLRNSVAELEALLAAKEADDDDDEFSDDVGDDDGGGSDDGSDEFSEKNQFPILPPDVVAIPSIHDDGDTGDDDSDVDCHSDPADDCGDEQD